MKKQNIITIPFIIVSLAFTPVVMVGEETHFVVKKQKVVTQSIGSSLVSILHKRGIDEEVAHEMVSSLVSDEDEVLLLSLIHNLEMQKIVTREEVLEYLSQAALHRQKLDFTSYDHILGMVNSIKQKFVDEPTRKYISELVKTSKEVLV